MNGAKVLVIGEILVEFMAQSVGEGFRESMLLSGPFPSGAPAIFIDQVAKLGQPCAIASCVGPDDFGRVNLERLGRDGVDVSPVGTHARAATGSAFVRYRANGDRDFVFNLVASACATVPRSPAVERALSDAGHLHVMGSSLYDSSIIALVKDAIASVKSRGGTVSFDPNIRKELNTPETLPILSHILDQTDLFLPSGSELTLLTQSDVEAEAIAEILARGVKAIVVKRGSAGASYYDTDQTLHQPALPAREIDPTGAGDCFGAAFVVSWLRGETPTESLALANASGARAVEFAGPMEGTSTLAELQTFMARSLEGATQ